MHKGQKGLTLIELLIVVAILGIIAAVVIPNLGAFMTTGRISAANTEAENVKTASLAYYAEYERWPITTNDADFMRYIAGNTTATYTICGAEGWLVSATTPAGTWDDISFDDGNAAPNGNHGTWRRAP